MKLYHTTKLNNSENINKNGLMATLVDNSDKVACADNSLQGSGLVGVYGFSDRYDAECFGDDNGGEYAIFEFEAENVIEDVEYDNNVAFLAVGKEIFSVKKVYEQDCNGNVFVDVQED